ncbi:TIGR03089 family protein [Cellulomonas terrae]|uniref:TIGR03089 family protein n=1 Tax=Cellulomonas terrae TaxID=311234 RepID=A0A511JI47_9CELL|nr:TIGR03089 family protein [Cellulomonas terrae]GEL97672.1 hypothetical protein CTE05_12190 [Cellulomonas terrae]
MPLTTIADLLDLLTREPGRPRITWYGDAGERVELSGAVLENWVNKTANLLVEEFDSAPGTRVRLDLPGHWRTVVWALATWRVGACVVTGDGSADVTVTDRPDRHPGVRDLVVVSLPALARRYEGTLPPGAIDAAGAVMTYGDVLGWAPPVDPAAAALDDGARQVTHAELLAGLPGDEPSARERALLPATTGPGVDLVTEVVGVLRGDGSAVVVSAPLAQQLRDDPARSALLVSSERVTTQSLGTPDRPGTFR